MVFTFCTSGAIVFKAGKNVDANIKISGAYLQQVSDESEAMINATANNDLITNFSTLDANFKKVLQDVASSYGGMLLIQYDMSNFNSRQEAEIMLDVLHDRVVRGLALIKEDDFKTQLGAT